MPRRSRQSRAGLGTTTVATGYDLTIMADTGNLSTARRSRSKCLKDPNSLPENGRQEPEAITQRRR